MSVCFDKAFSLTHRCTNAASILQALDQRIASVRSESHSHASALEAFKEFRNSEYIRLASERAENKAGGGKGKGNKGDNRAFESTLPLYNSIPSEFGGESGKGGSAGGAVLGGGSGSGSGAGSGADAGRLWVRFLFLSSAVGIMLI